MAHEPLISNTTYSFFIRALVAFPVFSFIIANFIIVREYGSHETWWWSLPYSAMYYGLEPTQTLVKAYLILLFGFLLPFAWLLNPEKVKDQYGSAKFATTSIIKKMGLFSVQGVVLGKWGKQLLRYDKPLATLILAPPGTGKTVSIAVPNIIKLDNHSLVVHDPKGELARLTANYRKTFTKTVIFNFAEKNSAKFNPFCKTALPEDQSDWQSYIDNISTLTYPDQERGEDYWLEEGRNMFRLFALWELYSKGETSFYEIYESSKSESSIKAILNNIETTINKNINQRIEAKSPPKEEKEEKPASKFNDSYKKTKAKKEEEPKITPEEQKEESTPMEEKIGTLVRHMKQAAASPKQIAGIVGSFNGKLSIYTEDKIRNATTGRNQMPLRQMRKELYTTYLIVNEKDRTRLRPVISLMLEVMAKDLISEEPIEEDLRITFILDEFTRLKGIETVKTFPEICRGYNIATIYIAQDYEQIGIVFGKEMIKIFKSLAAYKVIFKQNSDDTAKMISSFIGDYTDTRRSENENKSGKSTSTSDEGRKLLSAQDILNLPENQIYIMVEGYAKHPIKCKPTLYYKEKDIKQIVKKYGVKTYKETMEEE